MLTAVPIANVLSSVVREPKESFSMTQATGKVLPTAIPELRRNSGSHPSALLPRAVMPVDLEILAVEGHRGGTWALHEEGQEAVRVPLAVRATAVLSVRQVSEASPAAVKASAVEAEAPVVAEEELVAGVEVLVVEAVVAADSMRSSLNPDRGYYIWRYKQ